jgi:hypothetical protein
MMFENNKTKTSMLPNFSLPKPTFIVCIDIDGVIAKEGPFDNYLKAEVIPGAKENITALSRKGYYIILYTSRWQEDEFVTKKWLEIHEIPYNKLILGKPLADIYIDDRAIKFEGWDKLTLV